MLPLCQMWVKFYTIIINTVKALVTFCLFSNAPAIKAVVKL